MPSVFGKIRRPAPAQHSSSHRHWPCSQAALWISSVVLRPHTELSCARRPIPGAVLHCPAQPAPLRKCCYHRLCCRSELGIIAQTHILQCLRFPSALGLKLWTHYWVVQVINASFSLSPFTPLRLFPPPLTDPIPQHLLYLQETSLPHLWLSVLAYLSISSHPRNPTSLLSDSSLPSRDPSSFFLGPQWLHSSKDHGEVFPCDTSPAIFLTCALSQLSTHATCQPHAAQMNWPDVCV